MLSTKAGLPIAKIVNNDKYTSINLVLPEDEQLNEDAYKQNDDIDVFDFISEDEIEHLFKSRAGMKNHNFEVPRSLIEKAEKRSEVEFMIKDGSLEPMPNLRNVNPETGGHRDVIFVAGPSGSGKSTYIGKYIKNFLITFPEKRLVVISKVANDPAFDKFNPIRIEITRENIIDNPISVAEFKDCCVVFDDIDTIVDKDLCKAVQRLRDDCMEIGRHDDVTVCATSHLLMNYKLTRSMINEAQAVTFYPRSGSTYQITNFLKQYGGLTASQIARVLALPSRWVTLYKNYPGYIFYEKGAYLLSSDHPILDKKLKRKDRNVPDELKRKTKCKPTF